MFKATSLNAVIKHITLIVSNETSAKRNAQAKRITLK